MTQAEAWYREGVQAYSSGDLTKTVSLYRKAAEAGYATAQLGLGYLYTSGRGVAKSDTEALKWFEKAAAQGDRTAKAAVLRATRQLITRDPKSSAYWIARSLAYGDSKLVDDLTNRVAVLEVQKLLKGRGLYQGALDGITGPQTRAAMRKLLPN